MMRAQQAAHQARRTQKGRALDSSFQFPHDYFSRYDEQDDSVFYRHPRLTVHLDPGAIKALQKLFLQELPFGGVVLDLMSSYRSHLPPALPVERTVGLGLNGEEMHQNRQLDERLVHDLNQHPRLPFDDASFDAVICTVSVQYLIRPIEVFTEVGRVLRPGGPFIVSFSNRCFPSKAVRIWLCTNDQQHLDLVQMYFVAAGCFTAIEGTDISPCRVWGDRIFAVRGRRAVGIC
jgi:SAM-dependent methyltransferase